MTSPHRLPDNPQVPRPLRSRLLLDFERFKTGLPADLPAVVRERYGMDLTAQYAGRRIRLPFGKASGQLSLSAAEVQADADAGIGFVVLKTVIAEDSTGRRSMEAWAIRETAMRVEPIVSASGRHGWTVTWKGRGWDRSFDDYLALYREALEIGSAAEMPVAASVKYHLPGGDEGGEGDEGDEGDEGEGGFRVEEYEHTTRRIAEVGGRGAIIEKDFSPTLAGDHRAAARGNVLRWIREVPRLVSRAARVTLGLKLMNALFDDAFQVQMLRAARDSGADFLVCFNRLFDPAKRVAYGGWDLSDRNLRVLDLMTEGCQPTAPSAPTAPLITGFSATGNICSGRLMTEYALRGATAGQVHTYFQLPLGEYPATEGSRSARALHALLFHPEEGLIAWMAHLGETGALAPREGALHFLDIAHERARHSA